MTDHLTEAVSDTSAEGRLAGAIACLVATASMCPERQAALFLEAAALIRAYGDERVADDAWVWRRHR